MTNTLPRFEVRPGAAVCLHVGNELSIYNEDFVASLESQLREKQLTVSSAIPLHFKNTLLSRVLDQTASGWLACKCWISKRRAQEIIERINSTSLKPDFQLRTLAGTPRALLAIAVAIRSKPQVLLYSTCGLDHVGVLEVHGFVGDCRKDLGLFAVHISTPSVHGDGSPAKKICPPECCCLDF